MNILASKTKGIWHPLSEGLTLQQFHIYLPWLRSRQIGLGDVLKRIISRFGIQPCELCNQRAQRLNSFLVFSSSTNHTLDAISSLQVFSIRRFALSSDDPCLHFYGSCTGFGSRQCVIAPASLDPAAGTIEHCCSGWFQYPWIEVCPDQPPRTGCSICFW